MIQDALTKFAAAQSTTTSVAHTDLIDTLAVGDQYAGDYFVFQVSTTFTATGAPSLKVELQTSDAATFDTLNTFTLVSSNAYLVGSLTAGKFFAVRIPVGAKRYLRAYNNVTSTAGTAVFSAGAWNSFITPDIDLEINRRYLLQV